MHAHETPKNERLAGYFHLGFAALYLLACLWHIKGAREHFYDC